MKIFSNELGLLHHPLSSSYFLLDIETTGLLKTQDAIICIGVLYKKPNSSLCSMQWFAENIAEEKEILQLFLKFTSSFQKVYGYNSNSFDVPFILSRLDYHTLESLPFKSLLFLDIKKALSKLNLKRLSLEHLLGYQRQTTVTGKELTKLYKAFETTSLLTYQTIILNHNSDELNSLMALYEIYHLIYRLSDYKILNSISLNGYLHLYLQLDFTPYTCFTLNVEDFHINWDAHLNVLNLRILLYKGVLKRYLTPAKDYYLAKDQNQLVHKSIAQFIPTHLKQKVNKNQCFIAKSGTFIKLYKVLKVSTESKLSLESWYNEHNEVFIEYQDHEQLPSLLVQHIKYLLCS